MKAIGLDIGTTTISVVVMDVGNRRVLEARTIENGSFIDAEDAWERIQDVSVIGEKIKLVLDELLISYPDVQSIGLTGQMHGILYVDMEGQPLSPLYTWQDQRGNLPGEDGKTMVERIYDRTFLKTASGYGLVTHLCLTQQKCVPQRAAKLCTIPDYIGMLLTGRQTPLLHTSMAASLGFFDARNNCFKTDSLVQMGVDLSILPQVTKEIEILGSYQGIPVTVSIGDNQASFLGSVGLGKDTLLVNIGTGGQISVFSESYFEAEGIEARPFMGDSYLLVGSSLCGGRAYSILEKFFRSYAAAAGCGQGSQYDTMGKLAEEALKKRIQERVESDVGDSDDMHIITTFQGTRVDPSQRGSILNINEDNFTAENLVFGVLTGMAQELYDMFLTIQKGTAIRAEKLIGSGNGIRRNKVLQSILEQMFGAALILSQYQEEAACGAAISSWNCLMK